MKLAWLVWLYDDGDFPVVMEDDPSWYYKKVQIVYIEVTKHEDH